MATKTLILRPVSALPQTSSATAYIRFPSDTPDDQLHLLINEIEADDDATYLGGNNSVDSYDIKINGQSNLLPTSMKVVVRAKAVIDGTSLQPTILYLSEDGTETYWNAGFITLSSEWVTNYFVVPEDNLLTVWSSFESAYASIKITFSSPDGTKVDMEGIYTQVYLEVDYDDGTGADPVMYRKVSNAWEPVYGTVYNKVDGAWVEGTLDGLADGNSVTVVEV